MGGGSFLFSLNPLVNTNRDSVAIPKTKGTPYSPVWEVPVGRPGRKAIPNQEYMGCSPTLYVNVIKAFLITCIHHYTTLKTASLGSQTIINELLKLSLIGTRHTIYT